MTKVYLLTQGSYSDYHIVAAYSTKERADAGLAKYTRDSSEYTMAKLEEYELDSYIPITDYWISAILKDGTVSGAKRDVLYPSDTPRRKAGANFYQSGVEFYIPTDDKERAIKIALEKWTQIQAQNMWGNNRALSILMGDDGGWIR